MYRVRQPEKTTSGKIDVKKKDSKVQIMSNTKSKRPTKIDRKANAVGYKGWDTLNVTVQNSKDNLQRPKKDTSRKNKQGADFSKRSKQEERKMAAKQNRKAISQTKKTATSST